MKLKAYLTEGGVNLLERRFLPALDRLGKVCHLYLTRDHAIFLHNLLSPGAVQSVAQFEAAALFDDYRISSRNDDRIAFAIDLSLLHRAVRSAGGLTGGEIPHSRLQLKLVKKLPRNSTHEAPFLTLETKGYKSALVQDVPISKPLSRADIVDLQAALDSAGEVPRTMVHLPDMNKLVVFTERMKQVGEELRVCVTMYGGINFQISTALITLGAEFSGLVVVGEGVRAPEDPDLSAQTRAERAVRRGHGMSVRVSLKNFCKSLGCQLAKPDCAFYGITPDGACLMVVYQFFAPGTRETDKSISLHCRVPVLDPGLK